MVSLQSNIRSEHYKILLTGATGQVGSALLPLLREIGQVWAPTRAELDISIPTDLKGNVTSFRPSLIVNAAAYTAVDDAETNIELAEKINQTAPKILAQVANFLNIPLIHFSTDYVFDGQKQEPYIETDDTNPINVYGASKLLGEKRIIESHDKFLIFRTAWVYDKSGGSNFYQTILRLLEREEEIGVVDDEVGNPTSAGYIARTVVKILREVKCNDETEYRWGVYHLVEDEALTRYQFACKILSEVNKGSRKVSAKIKAISGDGYKSVAERPKYSCLSTLKLRKAFDIQG